MRRRLITLIIADILLLAAWDIWVHSLPEHVIAIGLVLIVPILILLSGVVGVAMVFHKNCWASAVLLNMVIAFVLCRSAQA